MAAAFVTGSGGYATHWSGTYNLILGVAPLAGETICVCIRYTPGHAGATPAGTGWTMVHNATVTPQNECAYMMWVKTAAGTEGTTIALVRNAGAQISWSTAFLVSGSSGLSGTPIALQSASTSVAGPSLTAAVADSLGVWWTSRYAITGAAPTLGAIAFNSASEQALVRYAFGPGASGTNTIPNIATQSIVVGMLFAPTGGAPPVEGEGLPVRTGAPVVGSATSARGDNIKTGTPLIGRTASARGESLSAGPRVGSAVSARGASVGTGAPVVGRGNGATSAGVNVATGAPVISRPLSARGVSVSTGAPAVPLGVSVTYAIAANVRTGAPLVDRTASASGVNVQTGAPLLSQSYLTTHRVAARACILRASREQRTHKAPREKRVIRL